MATLDESHNKCAAMYTGEQLLLHFNNKAPHACSPFIDILCGLLFRAECTVDK